MVRSAWVFLVLAAAALADTAVPRNGAVQRGVKADLKARTVQVADETRSLSRYLLVEGDDGGLIWAASFRDRVLGYRRIIEEGRRAALVAMAKEALRARDHATARRLYDWVKKEGLSGKEERILRKRVENAERKPRKRKEDRIAPVLEREARLRSQLPDLILGHARKELSADGVGLALLREALRADANHSGSLALLEEQAPDETPLGDARSWLDWHLDLSSKGFRFASKDNIELKRALHEWRPDLYGVVSEDMLLLTPVRDFDVVGDILR